MAGSIVRQMKKEKEQPSQEEMVDQQHGRGKSRPRPGSFMRVLTLELMRAGASILKVTTHEVDERVVPMRKLMTHRGVPMRKHMTHRGL